MYRPQKTIMIKEEESKKQWFILDATDKVLGRFAAEVVKILEGKHKPTYMTYADCGDGVIVINADKIRVTGSKAVQKIYRHNTGHMSGMRETTYEDMMERHPERIIEHAVAGMMPKNRLSRQQLKHFRVYAGAEHEHDAQKPIKVNI
jgi:large subunit ribosomal protein L13